MIPGLVLNCKVLVGVEIHVTGLDLVEISALNLMPNAISEHL
jgi:hypothetical protein